MNNTYPCIVCPRSCRVQVQQAGAQLTISGHGCPRGLAYAKAEHTCPQRTLTSTIKVTNGVLARLPVITSCAVPKAALPSVLAAIVQLCVYAPVHMGDVLVENIAGTEANLVACRSLKQRDNQAP